MKMTDPLGSIATGLAEETLAGLVPRVLPEMGKWAAQTVRALDKSQQACAGFRDLEYALDGSYVWEFPCSNSSERISAFLWLIRIPQ